MTFKKLLEKLRDDSPDGASARLAALAVDDFLSRKVGDLLEPARTAVFLQEWILAWLASDASKRLDAAYGELLSWLDRHQGPLSALLSGDAKESLRDLAKRPLKQSREILLDLLNREPVRELVREMLLEALIDFGQKLRAPVGAETTIGRGLGGLGRLKDRAKARSGALGALASGMVGAISDEVERQVEKKATDFADNALEGVIERLVDRIVDPARAKDQAAMRVAILDGILSLTGKQVAEQLRSNDPLGAAAHGREALTRWAKDPASKASIEQALRHLLGRDLDKTIGEVLEDLKLLAPFRKAATQATVEHFGPFLQGEPFAEWLEALMKEK